eukprot:3396725-Rhodomonas_salina.2
MLAFLRLRGGQRPESPKIRGSSRNAAAEAASDAHDAEKICGPQSVKQEIVIEASAEECFAAASNFEDYPKWAGAAKKVTVKERQADGLGTLVDFVSHSIGCIMMALIPSAAPTLSMHVFHLNQLRKRERSSGDEREEFNERVHSRKRGLLQDCVLKAGAVWNFTS